MPHQGSQGVTGQVWGRIRPERELTPKMPTVDACPPWMKFTDSAKSDQRSTAHPSACPNAKGGHPTAARGAAWKSLLSVLRDPVRRIDRLCITCCFPTFTSRQILDTISLGPQRDRIIVTLAPGQQRSSNPDHLVGERNRYDLERSPRYELR